MPMPPGFYFLIGAQFASGLADNALLIVTMRFLQEQGQPAWWAPLLKFSFNLAYVLLAPFMGPLADAVPKPRLMAWMNALKVMGVLCLLIGAHPLLAFGVIGLAAAAYAPAKYGLVTESVPAAQLVRANGWLEVSVVGSVILGTALGGVLVGQAMDLAWDAPAWPWASGLVRTDLWLAFGAVVGVYAMAAGLNAGIRRPPGGGVRLPLQWRHVAWSSFLDHHQRLWRDRLGGYSLYITTLYWGVGAVMQFVVLAWAQSQLGLGLAQGAYLQAMVAFGVMVGAALAGRFVRLYRVRRVVPFGLLLALLLPTLAWVHSLWLAVTLLTLAGVLGGLLLVPMNALLQHRGARVLSAGRSVAVQGFNENASVLVMLALYSASVSLDIPLWAILLGLSAVLTVGLRPDRLRWAKRS